MCSAVQRALISCGVRDLVFIGLALSAFGSPRQVASQTVAGTVRDRSADAPIAGVLVSLLSAADGRLVAHALTDADGKFSVRGSVAGNYLVSFKRIGIRPISLKVDSLALGEVRRLNATVDGIVVPLERVRIVARSLCGRAATQSAETARLLEETRAALTAGVLVSGSRSLATTIVRYTRTLDPASEEVKTESVTVRKEPYQRPFASIGTTFLAARGFVHEDPDGSVTFFAPDPEVLSSDWFVENHCFQAVASPSDSELVGLAIHPLPRQSRPDIDGVLWVDRASAELRRLDVRYTGSPLPSDDRRLGARVDFTRLEGGRWIVSEWVIRAPLVRVYTSLPSSAGGLHLPLSRTDSLVAIQEDGGFVDAGGPGSLKGFGRVEASVRSPASGASSRTIVILSGTGRFAFADSAGRFVFDSVVPGRYSLLLSRQSEPMEAAGFATARIDVKKGQSPQVEFDLRPGADPVRCRSSPSQRDRGMVMLVLLDTAAKRVLAGVDLSLRTTIQENVSRKGLTLRTYRHDGRTSLDGSLVFCDEKVGEDLQLELSNGREVSRYPLGALRRASGEVRHVLLAARPLAPTP
jgi:carboxypeptidase family protein